MKKQENNLLETLNSNSVNRLSKEQMKKISGGKDYEEAGIETAEGEGEEEEME